MALIMETRHLRQARAQIEAMDPTVKDYMEKITSSMEEFRLELRNNTTSVHAKPGGTTYSIVSTSPATRWQTCRTGARL